MTDPSSTDVLPNPPSQSTTNSPVAWQYVAPFAVFLIGTQLESQAVDANGKLIPNQYVMIYCGKIIAVIIALWFSRKSLLDLLPLPKLPVIALSVLLGALITAFWVGLDGLYPGLPEFMGKRSAFDPTTLDNPYKILFMIFRATGLVLIVPVIEELFTRDFLLRFVTEPQWEKVAPWAFNSTAAGVSLALFVMGHPEWLPALLCGIIWLWLLRSSKSVSALVISHSVANLGLGIYSLATGDWHFL